MLAGNGKLIPSFGPFYAGFGSFTWWVATLFMIGSFCFAAGTLVAVSESPEASGIVYFVGSIFFTTAGFGQLLSAINGTNFENPRFWARIPDSVDWKASVIQSFGTLCFNVSTGFALAVAFLDTQQSNRLIWSPDFLARSHSSGRAGWRSRQFARAGTGSQGAAQPGQPPHSIFSARSSSAGPRSAPTSFPTPATSTTSLPRTAARSSARSASSSRPG